jgi:hypothetical protein
MSNMLTRSTLSSPFRRAVGLAVAAALVLPVAVPPAAQARSAAAPAVSDSKAVAGQATDFSARKKVRRGYRGNAAAGAAMMGLTLGAMGAIIAEQRRRDYYRDHYYYGGGPYYGGHYYGGRPYYGGGPFYTVPHY